MIIYKIKNNINGKIYIGQTINKLTARISQHLNRKNGSLINLALNKYGINSFDISVIDNAEDRTTLTEKECYWIKTFNCKTPNGYNLTDGGEGLKGICISTRIKMSNNKKGKLLSSEHKQKLSNANKGKVSNRKGKTMSKEAKIKISKANKGKIVSQETKDKIRNTLMGHTISKEVKEKISNTLKGNKNAKSRK
jgi:group I intron endonuclease